MNSFTTERIIAIIRLVCPLIMLIAAGFGLALDWNMLATVVICVCALASFIWSWWKNNNITIAAQEAQIMLNRLKAEFKEAQKELAYEAEAREAEDAEAQRKND